jgi:acyl dehydratase
MKFKVFTDSNAAQLETQINRFLDPLGPGAVIKTETVVTAIAEKPNDGTHPCIVVTVWYEPPSD